MVDTNTNIENRSPEYQKGFAAGSKTLTAISNPHKRVLMDESGKVPIGDNPDYFEYNAGYCDAQYAAFAAEQAKKTPEQRAKEQAVIEAEAKAKEAKDAADEAAANLKDATKNVAETKTQ